MIRLPAKKPPSPTLDTFGVSSWDYDDEDDSKNTIEPNESGEKLLWAAQHGELNMVRSLVSTNSKLLNVKDKDGYTPLHRAIYSNKNDVVNFLLSVGADITSKTVDKWTPLHSACKWNNVQGAALLLQNGADINAASEGYVTPLHLAASQSYTRDILLLLLMDPLLQPELLTKDNDTAAQLARRHGPYEYIFQIAEPAVNICVKNHTISTPPISADQSSEGSSTKEMDSVCDAT